MKDVAELHTKSQANNFVTNNPDNATGSNVAVSSAHVPNGSAQAAPNSAGMKIQLLGGLFHMSNPA